MIVKASVILSLVILSLTSTKVEQPFLFSPLSQTLTHKVEIDRSTISDTLDSGGDRLVGALIRITSKSEHRFQYVNAMVAACTFDRVILLRSKMFDKEGKNLATIRQSALLNASVKGSVNELIYTELCNSESTKPYDGKHLFDFWNTPEDSMSIRIPPGTKLLDS